MSQPVATFSPPDDFDAVALARSTDRALQVLLPWCQVHNFSELTFAGDIAAQALTYVEAIDFSVVAAQNGFTVAEDAISLGDLIPISTPNQHQSYLEGMLKLARDGRNNAAKTLQTFRDVRKNVLALLRDVEPRHDEVEFKFSIHVNGQMNTKTKDFGALRNELRTGIGDLEEFATNIDNFATWWNWMKMEASSQETRTQTIQFNYSSLRLSSVLRKWGELKKQYAAYADEIGRIQDCYPTIFESMERDRGQQEQEQRDRRQDLEAGEKQDQGIRPDVQSAPVREPLEYERLPSHTESPKDQYTPSACGHELTGSVLMNWDMPPAEYLSATFTKAEYLGDRKSFLILDFQCHPSRGRRFTDVTITWKFKARCCATPTSPPKVVYAAPRRSVGGRTDEERRTLLGLRAPIQLQTVGASIGIEAKAELEVQKVIPHAMVMTGTIRGDPADCCVWTVKENGSNGTGIPPHFRIAVVLEHDEPFATMLDVKAKVEGRWWWPKTFRFHTKRVVDVGILKGRIESDPEWRKDVQGVTGEVPYAAALFSQPIVA